MTETTYLSYIANASTVIAGTGEPHDNALALYSLMCDDPAQRRPVCIWDERIAAVAQARCDMMLADGAIFIHHLDKNGMGPNRWLRWAGIALPDWYDKSDAGNNVESIGLNYITAALCWQGWLASPDHRTHVLGDGMFDEQTLVGIGFSAPAEAKYPIFWCLISCPEAT